MHTNAPTFLWLIAAADVDEEDKFGAAVVVSPQQQDGAYLQQMICGQHLNRCNEPKCKKFSNVRCRHSFYKLDM